MRLRFFISALLLTSVVLMSCNSKKTKAVSAQHVDIAEPFNITYSESGGIAGTIASYHIASSGLVEFFEKMPGQQDSLIWSKNVSAQELAALQQSLASSTILNEPLSETGNMTSTLQYSTADTSYSLSWAGVGAMADVSGDMKTWLAQLKTLLEK